MPSADPRPPQDHQRRPIKTGTWLPVEDNRLREAVARHGTRWVLVAGDVGSRNGDQCAKRWNENLNPKLDHSAWTVEEEQNLLGCVNLYGHNWKFIADNFFPTRAPLALKNRFSLLMRRSKGKGNNQHSQQSTPNSGASTPQFGPYWYPPNGNPAPSSSGSTIDSASFPADGQSPLMQLPDYGVMESILHTAPRTSTAPGTPTSTATALTAGEDQNLVWPHSPFDSTTNQLEGAFGNPGAMGADTPMSSYTMIPEIYAGKLWTDDGISSAEVSRPASPGMVDSEMGSEYSVTCQRNKLRTVVNHLVDAAMSENAEWSRKDDPVTLRLRLNA